MTQKFVNTARGLKTFKNELILPEGSMLVADNVIIDRDNVVEPRRGFKVYSATFGTDTDRASQLLEYKNRLLLHYDTNLLYDDGSGNFTAFSGSFGELETGLRIKGIEQNSNFYFTTTSGIKKISARSASQFSSASGYIYDAGAPKALDGSGTADTGTPGFMDTESVVGYRTVWGYKDVNENLVLGSPSEIIITRNLSSSSTAVVDLTFTIPAEIIDDSKYFYQIYRSPVKDDSTSPGTAVPEDELQLVFEDFPSASDFTNGYVSTTDITPEDFREGGAPLYTNPISGQGILQANERPPLSKDLAEYRNSVFYANTKTRHQKQVSIISTALLANDDEFILGNSVTGDVTYIFKATENIGSRHVLLATGGSVGQNIDDTARSLVRVVNRNSGPVYAYYISGVEDVPGQILFESRELSDIEFYVKVGSGVDGTAFNPQLPEDNSEVSNNLESPNRLYYSKLREPEAVPVVNYEDIGAKDSPIVRIAALRDSLFIFKTDGIYRLSGTDTENFTVTLSDSSAIITSADSLSILNNEIYLATSQGIVSISEAGQPRVISRDIESDILQPTQFSSFSTATFGISSESDRAYMLFIPTISSDTVATQVYRFNVFTQTWVRWPISKTCGIVKSDDDMIYLGTADLNQLESERKSFDRTDYSDREYSNSIPASAVSGTEVEISSLSNVAVADVIYQQMYISIARFNRVLRKLDADSGLNDTDYESTLIIDQGAALNNSLAALVTKIKADDTGGSYSTPSGANDIETIKTEFNTLMTELNASAQTFYSNYRSYTDLIEYESIIQSIDTGTNTLTVYDTIPFIQGAVTIFKSISCELEWAAQSVGDVSLMKQFRDATIMFDQFNFTLGTASFRSDLSDNYEDSDFTGEGNGAFGSQVYGNYTHGGLANQIPHRTYVPRNKQRCRFINVRYLHSGARETFGITGYSVTFNKSVTERAYKD